eukprot:8304086-Pyramimonas_sp.AAC.1
MLHQGIEYPRVRRLAEDKDAEGRLVKAAAHKGVQARQDEMCNFDEYKKFVTKHLKYVAQSLGEWSATAPSKNKGLAAPEKNLSPPAGAASALTSWSPSS